MPPTDIINTLAIVLIEFTKLVLETTLDIVLINCPKIPFAENIEFLIDKKPPLTADIAGCAEVHNPLNKILNS